ncbi:MAG: hypothetical protein ACE5JL_11675 [Dehalococcoidia bacterium]
MAFFAQLSREHTYMHELVTNGHIDAILGNIAHGLPSGLHNFVAGGGRIFVDPLTFRIPLLGKNTGTRRFVQLPYVRNFTSLDSLTDPDDLRSFAELTVDEQIDEGATDIITPYFLIDDVRSTTLETCVAATEIALDAARRRGLDRVWTGILVGGDELKRPISRDRLLAVLTAGPVERCYLLVDVDQSGSGPLRDVQIIRALREVVVELAKNDIRVLLGYADPMAVCLTVDGLEDFASGVTASLRRLNVTQIRQGRRGHRPAARRYYMTALMNFVRIDRELTAMMARGFLAGPGCGCGYCGSDFRAVTAARKDALGRHYLATLRHEASAIVVQPQANRLPYIRQRLSTAALTYDALRRAGVQFEPDSGPGHIEAWQQALA